MGNRLIISIINLQLCWYFRNRGVNLSVNYRRNINNKDADLASCETVSLPVPRFATSFIRIHLWKQSTRREEEDVNEVDGYAWWWYNEIRSGVKFLEAINVNRDSWWWSHRVEKRSWRLDSAGLATTWKLLNDHGERGDAVNLSVTWLEMSSTHFFEAVLQGTPRTPVGGERLDKHGALSDGPSAAALPSPSMGPLCSTPATRCCGEVDKKVVLSRASLPAPYPFRFDRFNFVLMSFAHSSRRGRLENPYVPFMEINYSAQNCWAKARDIAVVRKFVRVLSLYIYQVQNWFNKRNVTYLILFAFNVVLITNAIYNNTLLIVL